jgi:hypothetical protein
MDEESARSKPFQVTGNRKRYSGGGDTPQEASFLAASLTSENLE